MVQALATLRRTEKGCNDGRGGSGGFGGGRGGRGGSGSGSGAGFFSSSMTSSPSFSSLQGVKSRFQGLLGGGGGGGGGGLSSATSFSSAKRTAAVSSVMCSAPKVSSLARPSRNKRFFFSLTLQFFAWSIYSFRLLPPLQEKGREQELQRPGLPDLSKAIGSF